MRDANSLDDPKDEAMTKRGKGRSNINEDESLAETKRCKTEKEDQIVNEPKVDFNHLKESPFLEQLKFAKCFLNENQSFFLFFMK